MGGPVARSRSDTGQQNTGSYSRDSVKIDAEQIFRFVSPTTEINSL